jgi:hypothetical protein
MFFYTEQGKGGYVICCVGQVWVISPTFKMGENPTKPTFGLNNTLKI